MPVTNRGRQGLKGNPTHHCCVKRAYRSAMTYPSEKNRIGINRMDISHRAQQRTDSEGEQKRFFTGLLTPGTGV